MFSRPLTPDESLSDFQQARDPPRIRTRPSVGSVMRLRILSSVDFARTVATDDAEYLALFDFEGNPLQRPEVL